MFLIRAGLNGYSDLEDRFIYRLSEASHYLLNSSSHLKMIGCFLDATTIINAEKITRRGNVRLRLRLASGSSIMLHDAVVVIPPLRFDLLVQIIPSVHIHDESVPFILQPRKHSIYAWAQSGSRDEQDPGTFHCSISYVSSHPHAFHATLIGSPQMSGD